MIRWVLRWMLALFCWLSPLGMAAPARFGQGASVLDGPATGSIIPSANEVESVVTPDELSSEESMLVPDDNASSVTTHAAAKTTIVRLLSKIAWPLGLFVVAHTLCMFLKRKRPQVFFFMFSSSALYLGLYQDQKSGAEIAPELMFGLLLLWARFAFEWCRQGAEPNYGRTYGVIGVLLSLVLMWLIYPWRDTILQATGFPVTLATVIQLLIPLSFAMIEFFVYVYKRLSAEDPEGPATLTTEEPSVIFFQLYSYYKEVLHSISHFLHQGEEQQADSEAGEVTHDRAFNIDEPGQPVRARIRERPATPE